MLSNLTNVIERETLGLTLVFNGHTNPARGLLNADSDLVGL